MLTASLDPRGPVASDIADLFWVLLGLGALVYSLFAVLLVRALGRRQATEPTVRRRLLLGGGVILPLVVIAFVFAATIATLGSMPRVGDRTRLVVEITGHQWWWDVVYPGSGVRTANEMYIPVDEEIELRLLAADVVHSFWVPSLGGKTDLLPDRTTSLVIEAAEPGTFRGVCAEFCGLQHAKMRFAVVAVSSDEFASWLEQQAQPPSEPRDEAGVGRGVFIGSGCGECHRIEGTSIGNGAPDLTHLASRLTLGAGTLPNSTDHLRDWVGRPQDFKEGVDMENAELSVQNLRALVTYLDSLE
jgi:cytochrome c oxidase subunit II